MEPNFINVHHPDFIGCNMEKVRVEATADIRRVSEDIIESNRIAINE